MTQTEMFPEFAASDLPPDIQRDLAIVTGMEVGGPALQPNIDHGSMTAQEKFLAARAKAKATVERTIKNPKLLVLDLATAEGRADYEKFMVEIAPKAASDPEHWRITETTYPPSDAPTAPAGYRLLTTIRYYECDEVVVPGDHGYTIVPKGA